jgi:hypothetical protein
VPQPVAVTGLSIAGAGVFVDTVCGPLQQVGLAPAPGCSWSGTVDYGDGTGAQPLTVGPASFLLGHTYAAAGSYTVVVTVSDGQGGSGTWSSPVVVPL